MQRTNYWNQTRPTDTQLGWTETSKINAINERLRSSAQMGVAWGFQVTVNSVDNTKIDIARGEGYSGGMFLVNEFETAGSGQRISTYTDSPSGVDDTGPAATAQGLADYTAGVKNYVSLVYGELASQPLGERTYPFTNRQTVVTETFTVSVLTEAQWNALGSEAVNNRILVAIVTAQGAGTTLTSADIDQFVQPKTLPTTSQPQTISGVTIVGVADITPLGIGTLRWDPSLNQMFWTAPGDTEGIGLSISDSGVFSLASANANYTLSVNVVWGSLSLVAVDTSENIRVQSLYGRTIPMFSGVDQIHRDMIGSGQPSPTNAHGMTLADIGGGTLDHADLFHLNGISKDAESTQLECHIDDAINDRIQVTSLGGYENSFLVDGKTLTEVSGSNYVNFDTLPQPDSGEYLIYIDSGGNLGKVQIGEAFTNFTNLDIWDIHNTVAGTGEIQWDATNEAIRYKAPGDAWGNWVFVSEILPEGSGYYGMHKVYSSTTTEWIILHFNGVIGASNTETFTIVKDETDYADETMLKLAVINWNKTTEILSDLRDIRRFVTADNRTEFEEEHDSDGLHTKTLQSLFRVDVGSADVGAIMGIAGSSAIYGSASSMAGVAGSALTNGVWGSADTIAVYGMAAQTGGYFAAAVTGVYGEAAVRLGGYFAAPNTAVYAEAAAATAIWASALNSGVVATAGNARAIVALAPNYGVSAVVASSRAVYGSASSVAAYFVADHAYGMIGIASSTAIYGSATVDYGVIGTADTFGVWGEAAVSCGVYGSAASTGIYGIAATNYGVRGIAGGVIGVDGSAPNTAGRFIADTDIGVSASAAAATGVYGIAPVTAIMGTSPNTAGYFGVATETAIYGIAGSSYGVVGSAGNLAGSFNASSNWNANNVIGVYGSAENGSNPNSAIGVLGFVGGSAATGVYGGANHAADGTGVYGSASNEVGVYGIASATGVIGSGAIGVFGKAAIANGTGIKGSAENAGGIGGAFLGATVAISLSCPAVASPTATATWMPVSYNGDIYTLRLWQ